MGMQEMLNEEIKTEFEALKKAKPGDDTHRTTVDSLAKLMDRAIELKRIEANSEELCNSREVETDLKIQQVKYDKKDRVIKKMMAGARYVATIVVTIWGTGASMNFEKEGTITTSAGRKHLNMTLSLFK